MINSIKARTPILALILFVFAVGYTVAAKVVVVPLGSDAPQSFAVFDGGEQDSPLSSTAQKLRELPLTAPVGGIVIVNSTVSVHADTAGSAVHCSITRTTARLITPSINFTHLQYWISGGVGASRYTQMAGTRGFNVTAGERYYYRLVCTHKGTGLADYYDSSLTAIFTPST